MSSGPATKTPKKSRKEKLASIAEWDALARRYPAGGRKALVQQIVLMLAGNAFTVYLLVTHRMQPVHLVLLVAIEAVLLSVVSTVQSAFVPPESRPKSSGQTPVQRIFTLAFGLFWLTVVYSLVFAGFFHMDLPFEKLLRNPRETLEQAGMLWPLGITLLAALVDSVKDAAYFRREGGIFLSTPGLNAIPRWLTLFLGGIPFFVPLAAFVFGISKMAERLNKRPDLASVTGLALVIPILALGMFGLIRGLLSAGISGWAIGYCSAKVASELLILCLPVIAVKARAEEIAAL